MATARVRYARERILRGGDTSDWAASWRAFTTFGTQDRLGTLAMPTLVLAGEADSSTTPEVMAGLAARISTARYQELPGTPHMQSLEQPDLVAHPLDQFLPADESGPR